MHFDLNYLYLVLMCAAVLFAAARGLFKWLNHLDTNTRATEALTAAFSAFTEKTGDKLEDHQRRLTWLEARQEIDR